MSHFNTSVPPTLFPFTCCSHWLHALFSHASLLNGQPSNEPSGRGVVMLRYCDLSDSVAHKTLWEPHIVNMYRHHTHVLTQYVFRNIRADRHETWRPVYIESTCVHNVTLAVHWRDLSVSFCGSADRMCMSTPCSFTASTHLTLWWDRGLLTSVCLHDLTLFYYHYFMVFPLIVLTWSFSLNHFCVTARNNSVMRVETIHVSAPGVKSMQFCIEAAWMFKHRHLHSEEPEHRHLLYNR